MRLHCKIIRARPLRGFARMYLSTPTPLPPPFLFLGQLSVAQRKKQALLKMVDAESKTSKLASNRNQQLEEKLKNMAADKTKAELKRAELEKEVTDLRKKIGLFEQRV